MKTQLAFHNLTYQSAKTLVSVAGVAFALVLVFMQLGFMGAVSHTAVNVFSHLHFDALIRSTDYLHLYEADEIEMRWLHAAKGTAGVKTVVPLWITLQTWGSLEQSSGKNEHLNDKKVRSDQIFGQYLPIAVMGIRPNEEVFDLDDVKRQRTVLSDSHSVLIDSSTRSDYGPIDGRRFTMNDCGRETEIGGQKVTIGGIFELGTGLAANGAVLVGERCFQRLVPSDCERFVSLGLVQFDGTRPAGMVLNEIRQRLQRDSELLPTYDSSKVIAASGSKVQTLSREEVLRWERKRWLQQTPIGLIFQLGVGLSLMVGAAIVYMVLATDVMDRLPEYATLLAMGYSRLYLAGIVMTQAIVLAVLGFVTAWIAAELLYRLTSWASGIPIAMNVERIMLVASLGLLMCCVSGLLAMSKLWKAEPASLF